MIESTVICDSIGSQSPRLVTMLARYPKFVHSEHLRHRSFSFSVSSSRAIPISKNLAEVRSDELRAAPVWWGQEQKGMQSGDELSDELDVDPIIGPAGEYWSQLRWIQYQWKRAADSAAVRAEIFAKAGVHKSIVNRLLEPFLHVNVLVTGTEPGWMNFFGLRLDKATQPEIRALAEAQWARWCESKPQELQPDQWHLPFIDDEAICKANTFWENRPEAVLCSHSDLLVRTSVARCARLSYLSFETGRRSSVKEDLALYERLIDSSPIHASPAEHQATPDTRGPAVKDGDVWPEVWEHPWEAGNLGPGWRQFRKMLPGEAVARLPEGYAL